jgi:hypothetical protein
VNRQVVKNFRKLSALKIKVVINKKQAPEIILFNEKERKIERFSSFLR